MGKFNSGWYCHGTRKNDENCFKLISKLLQIENKHISNITEEIRLTKTSFRFRDTNICIERAPANIAIRNIFVVCNEIVFLRIFESNQLKSISTENSRVDILNYINSYIDE